ncbi:hypothetical protein TNCV_767371 [Trichonephila clavipes]|nr:hypothetical protein TNCV_767371 [Trichonephila clavipes]
MDVIDIEIDAITSGRELITCEQTKKEQKGKLGKTHPVYSGQNRGRFMACLGPQKCGENNGYSSPIADVSLVSYNPQTPGFHQNIRHHVFMNHADHNR